MKKYDFLIVGSGLFGSVFAHQACLAGKKCLIIDKRSHIGGNVFTKNVEGINVHWYGAHIFHTNDAEVWEYVTQHVPFNRYTNSPIANYKGDLYNLPFNMNTFYKLWGVKTPEQAKLKIKEQTESFKNTEPANLEEQALKLVGRDIYMKLIKGYTEKQWGREATKIPAFIIKRIPIRYTFDNNYFNDNFQGIPVGGYNALIEKLLQLSDLRLNTNYFENRDELDSLADQIVFTGMIDEYFDYCYGTLEYRSLRFENELMNMKNFQGNAVINYTEKDVPFTRIIEHKHFEFGNQENTFITKEYPEGWDKSKEAYYPINDERNQILVEKYKVKAGNLSNVHFGGRLADYAYYDMDQVIRKALDFSESIL